MAAKPVPHEAVAYPTLSPKSRHSFPPPSGRRQCHRGMLHMVSADHFAHELRAQLFAIAPQNRNSVCSRRGPKSGRRRKSVNVCCWARRGPVIDVGRVRKMQTADIARALVITSRDSARRFRILQPEKMSAYLKKILLLIREFHSIIFTAKQLWPVCISF